MLPHQHGCGQLGDDMMLTRELLAALASHPNVTAAILIALGCETNRSAHLLAAIRRRGGIAHGVGIQAAGGIEEAIDQAEHVLRAHHRPDLHEASVDSSELKVGVVADATARVREPALVASVAESLRDNGFVVIVPVDPDMPLRPAENHRGPLAIPARWRSEPRSENALLKLLVEGPVADSQRVPVGDDLVERMTAVTALGAHVLVCLNGRPSLVGAALAPTISVSMNPEIDGLDDLIDVPFAGDDLAGRVVAEVHAVIAGRQTHAERLGMRDLALPRLGPWY